MQRNEGKELVVTMRTFRIMVGITMLMLLQTVSAGASPTIEFTYVPPYGSFDNLQGKVTDVNPAEYKVAVYIYVSGWYTKPYYNSPLTPINSDGSWTCDITTGGYDQYATSVKAYLVPNGYNPPQMSGQRTFSDELKDNSVASIEKPKRPDRHIIFSGRDWIVKFSTIPEGPGPNYFSDSNESVWVDRQDRLHLKIVKVDDTWYSSEVILNESLGYGQYVFYTASRIDQLDQNVVLGMFTWETEAAENHYREMDIEYSKFSNPVDVNAQFVVQPWTTSGNRYRFNLNLSRNDSVSAFRWSADNVSFRSVQGENLNTLNSSDMISSWVYNGSDNPPPGKENARINLWLFDPNNVVGKPPSDGKEVEIIVKKFEFISPAPIGDLNGNGILADAGDLVLMKRASIGEIPADSRYDLNNNGQFADAGDLVLMKRASIGEINL